MFAVQRRSPLGGWITLQEQDNYKSLTRAILKAQTLRWSRAYNGEAVPYRVIDLEEGKVNWPPSLAGLPSHP